MLANAVKNDYISRAFPVNISIFDFVFVFYG